MLAGYGPVTANVARELAVGRALAADPDRPGDPARSSMSAPPSTGHRHHSPGTSKRAIKLCVAPGCGMPASRCDLDHVIPFPDGPTSADNLHPECKAHHLRQALGVGRRRAAARRRRCAGRCRPATRYDTRPPPVGQVWDVDPGAEPDVEEPWWADWRHDEPLCRTG